MKITSNSRARQLGNVLPSNRSLPGQLGRLRTEAVTFIRHTLLVLILGSIAAWTRPRRTSAGHELRVLIIRRDGIGDFVLTTPFLRELRRSLPEANITLLVGRNARDLAATCPYADAVQTIPLRNLTLGELLGLIKFARTNLRGQFDLVLLPRWDVDMYWSTLIACLSGAPRIIAYTRKTSVLKAARNWGYDKLLSDPLPPGDSPHEIDRALALATYLGGRIDSRAMEVWPTGADKIEADRYFELAGDAVHPRPWVALGIGASNGRKVWPWFGELLAALKQRMTFTPLAFVSSDELEITSRLREAMPECFLVSQPLRVTAVILSRCEIFVGNDSGLLHIAAAVGLPTVQISCHPRDGEPTHENSPARFGHVGNNGRAVQPTSGLDSCSDSCVEDFPHCISLVTPQQVMSAIESLIEVPV